MIALTSIDTSNTKPIPVLRLSWRVNYYKLDLCLSSQWLFNLKQLVGLHQPVIDVKKVTKELCSLQAMLR